MPRGSYNHRFFDNKGGLNTKSSPMAMPTTDSPELLNVNLDKTGSIRKRNGIQQYTASAIGAAGTIQGIFRLLTNEGGQYLVAIEGGTIYEESTTGTFTTARRTGLSSTLPFVGATYNNKLFMANGYDPIQVYAGGENAVDIGSVAGASIPAAWGEGMPSGIVLTHPDRSERLAAWGSAGDPSRVWFSSVQDGLDWAAGGDAEGFNILVLKDNGEPVKVVVPFYDLTICFKETEAAIYIGDSPITMSLQSVYPVGCPAPRSVVHVGNTLYFWSQQGPTEAKGVQEYGDIAPNHIGLKIEEEIQKNVNWNLVDQIVGIHDREFDRVIWCAPSSGNTQNNRFYIWYYDIGAWAIYDGVDCHSALVFNELSGDTQIYMGGYDGHINEFVGTYNDNSSAYTSRYVSPWYDFGDFTRRDRVLEMRFACGSGAFNVNVYYQWDFESDWYLIGNLSDLIDAATSIWGSVTWGSFVWGAGQEGTVKIHSLGSGRVFRIKLENTTADTEFHVLGWSILQAPRGRR